MNALDLWVLSAVFGVACLYSMVGHGGASAMLAVFSICGMAARQVPVAALFMNLVVATLALAAFGRARHFRWPLTWPLLVGSVPFALLGASVRLSDRTYLVLVSVILAYAGVQLIRAGGVTVAGVSADPPCTAVRAGTGAGIGLLSGLVGVGGGIFLSPLMILRGWADARQTSATSAAFIVANSAAGLAARAQHGLSLPASFWALAAAGAMGATIGGLLGARALSMVGLRRALGVVLLVAAGKLVLV